MEQKTQPVLCCLCGNEYSDPTQFVMERLFVSANLDWKVITAQIQAESIEEAVAGIQALRLSAIRFGQPFDTVRQSSFLTENPDVAFVGAISASLHEGNYWTGWHSFGPALVQLMGRKVDWGACTVILNGDSILQRSCMLALVDKSAANVFWASAEAAEADYQIWLEQSAPSTVQQVAFFRKSQLSDSLPAAIESSEHVVLIEPSQETIEALAAAEPDAWSKIVVWDPQNKVPQDVSALDSFHAISQPNLNIAIDEYDFRRWTGAEPNHSLLVDAHEEYCSF